MQIVSVQSVIRLALTLTLSPRRGNHQRPLLEKSGNDQHFPVLEKILPLPGGEGRGEGERRFQLISSSLAKFGIETPAKHQRTQCQERSPRRLLMRHKPDLA